MPKRECKSNLNIGYFSCVMNNAHLNEICLALIPI